MASPVNTEHSPIEKILKLVESTGCPLVQHNGQRIYGPPPDWKGEAPSRGSEVFVGKIPRDCFEDELVPVFSSVAEIHELRLMMDFSGTNRGYGFVKYTSPEDASLACDVLNNYEIRPGRRIGVTKSVDNRRLFLGNIPRHITKQEVYTVMTELVNGVTNVMLYSCAEDKTKNRGFAFIEFNNHREASMARRLLIPGKLTLWGVDVNVDWAQPEYEVKDDIMSQVKILYVRNLTLKTPEENIRMLFAQATFPGAVKRLRKLKDYAFVHFSSREIAQQAMDKMNGMVIDGEKIEIVWAKPPKSLTNFLGYCSHKQHKPKQEPNEIDSGFSFSPTAVSSPKTLQLPEEVSSTCADLTSALIANNPELSALYNLIRNWIYNLQFGTPQFTYPIVGTDSSGLHMYDCVAILTYSAGVLQFNAPYPTRSATQALHGCLLGIAHYFKQMLHLHPPPR